jgi:type II secretory pathway component GspD/PulD (secretin)
MKKAFVAMTVGALALAAALGADETKATSRAGTPQVLDERISLDLQDAKANEVLASLEKMSGLSIQLVNKSAAITVSVRNVRIRTILDVISDELGGTWNLDTNATPPRVHFDLPMRGAATSPKSSPHSVDEPISLDLKDAEIRDVFHTIARMLGARDELAPGIGGKVTIKFENTPLSKALDALCLQFHCKAEFVPSDQEPLLRISAAS